jgi:DNA-binding transcriptional LysR family regulator
MDIEHLKTFLEVERMRNFRKAAENLCISPSAVSARVRQLEQTLGLILFRRDRQTVSLSQPGERFKRHARFILSAWEHAHQEIALSKQIDKHLMVVGVNSLWEFLLQDWLNDIHCHSPLIGFRAESSTSKQIAQKLEQGTIDLGFIYEPPQRPIAAVRANVGSIALGLIESCGGAAYLPTSMVKDKLEQNRLFKVEDAPEIPLKAYAVYSMHGEDRALIEQLLQTL